MDMAVSNHAATGNHGDGSIAVPADARPEFDVRPAARFLASHATGLYGMDAVLGLN